MSLGIAKVWIYLRLKLFYLGSSKGKEITPDEAEAKRNKEVFEK